MSFTALLDDIIAENRNGLLSQAAGATRVPLGKIAKILNGAPFSSSEFVKTGGTPLIRIRDVLRGASETGYTGDYDPAYLVNRDEILVGMDGDFHCAAWQSEPSLLNQRVCKITPDPEKLLPKYLLHILPGYLDAINANTPSITVKHLSSRTLGDVPLPLPPLPTQHRIVAEIEEKLSRLDAAQSALLRAQANLKRYRASVLQKACDQVLLSAPMQNFGKYVAHIESGKSFKCEERPPKDHEIGVAKVSAVTWGEYDEQQTKTCKDESRIEERYLIKPGDFLFTRANTIELIGACVIAKQVSLNIMLSDKILRFHFAESLDKRWALLWLKSHFGRKEIERLSTGNQESMRNIGQERIRQIQIAVPSLETQSEIITEVERRLSVIDRTEQTLRTQLERAKRLRQSILQQAFSPTHQDT